jgi:hypothetical protein
MKLSVPVILKVVVFILVPRCLWWILKLAKVEY